MTELYALQIAEQAAEQAQKAKEAGNAMGELIAAMTAVVFAQVAIEGCFHSLLECLLLGKGREQEYKETMDEGRIEERVRKGLEMATGKTVETGRPPYQDFHILKDIRNLLVHYKPVWEGSEGSLSDVLKAVESQRKFILIQSRARWEEKVLSASCAGWACRTSVAMVKDMYDLGSTGGYPHGIADRLTRYGL